MCELCDFVLKESAGQFYWILQMALSVPLECLKMGRCIPMRWIVEVIIITVAVNNAQKVGEEEDCDSGLITAVRAACSFMKRRVGNCQLRQGLFI